VNVTATLFGQIGTFIVLVWFINRYLWEPMTKMMQDRATRIADGLAAAERGKHELELAGQRAAERLRNAKQEAADIIALANKRANEIVDEAKEKARLEGQRQLDAAKAEIELEVNRAKEHLREQAVGLAILTAEKILEREISPATHGEFIGNMIKKL
jgi:F-type H+-transporting ATPase subunit b